MGFMGLNAQASELNALSFVVNMIMGRQWTATVVRVVAATVDGSVAPPGFVDVQPLVKQVDGVGNTMPHGVIYRLPMMRIQAGATAIILDPQPDDIGVAVFASRDISAVKSSLDEAPPGSARRFDPADGIYLATVLGDTTPTQYIQFQGSDINIKAAATVRVEAPDIILDGDVDVTGTLHVAGAVTTDSTIVADGDVTGDGTSLHTHTHSGVQTGGSNTGPPA